MKLFLCGGGSNVQIMFALNKFKSVIKKDRPILYIPLAMNKEKYDSCKKWFSNELRYIGIDSFDMVKSSKELANKDLNNYAALFIGGGNTYKLLYELSKNGNREKIQNYLKNDGVMFGGSAGAIIFGKDINTCMLDDGNMINLKNCDGFNYLNEYSILCHLNKKNLKKNYKHLKEFSKNNKVIYLPEENVIFIDNNKIKFIGTSKYVKFVNGECFFHNFANFKKDINN